MFRLQWKDIQSTNFSYSFDILLMKHISGTADKVTHQKAVWITSCTFAVYFLITVSGSIFQGFEEQLNQTAEDVIPYYYKNNSKYNYEYYDHYNQYHYNDSTELLGLFLTIIVSFLSILTLICFIIMIIVCIKCCCDSGDKKVFAQSQGIFHKLHPSSLH